MFGQQMIERWNLTEMTVHNFNPQTPVIVLGMHIHKIPSYKKLIHNHKGPQIIFFGGSGDAVPVNLSYIKHRRESLPTYIFAKTKVLQVLLKKYNLPFTSAYIPFKDYSIFPPTPLGKKIYCHVGFPDHPQALKRLAWKPLVQPLIRKYGKDILYVPPNGKRFTPKQMYNLYKQCCVYIKPLSLSGSTTMWDMAYLGRKTICHSFAPMPHIIKGPPQIKNGKNLDILFSLINKEQKKAGTLNLSLIERVKAEHIHTEEWLNHTFWHGNI